MGRFKIWEILLFVAVVLLAALVYETHNAGGRYVMIDSSPGVMLDTRTGKIWIWETDDKEWVVRYPAIPKGL